MALMTNEELGRRIGVTHSMASRLRAGKRLPGVETLLKIHDEFGVDMRELAVTHGRGADAFGRLLRRTIKQHEATATAA